MAVAKGKVREYSVKMSDLDQENPDGSPRPKRSRLTRSQPFQVLSLPTVSNRQRNSRVAVSQSPNVIVELEPLHYESENSIAGVIKKLELTNFMCHGNFDIEFNPRINFISGANGSGKSAIQTAIAIGLGGTASKTNRSSKIEGLIKHGCHAGSIAITLSNTGSNAFRQDIYGNQIKIVRRITPSSSTYHIYNQWGKSISSKKADLDAITTKFKIQPNNPISILNQDMARNFLSSNKAENKYLMFKKATCLDEAEAMLANILAKVADHRMLILEKEKTEEIVDKEIDGMNEKMKLVDELKEKKKRKFQLENEYMWCEVHKHREELIRLEDICEEQENAKKELLEQVEEIKSGITERENKIEELQQNLATLENETRSKEETVQKYRKEFRDKRNKCLEKAEECKRIAETIKNKHSDKEQLQASLDDVEREENENKARKEEAQEKIARFQNSLKENESKVRVLQQEIDRLNQTKDELKQMKDNKERQLEELNQEIRANERQMGSLKNADNLSVYDTWMPTLVQRIEEAVQRGKFSKPPKGPLGRYIQVRHDQWTNAIESHLSTGWLTSFFVNNKDDRIELYKIMDQVVKGRKPTVHCSQFQERDRNNMLPQIEVRYGSYLNMYRALKISDPVVANFLMDSKNIHQVLLIEDTKICRQLMSDPKWVKNCSTIINQNADSYNQGCRYYANMRPTRARLLQKSVAHHLQSLKEEIEEKKHAMVTARKDFTSLNEKFTNATRKIEHLHSESEKCRNKNLMAARAVSELKRVINAEMPSLQTRVEEFTSLEKEIAELEEKKERATEEHKELHEAMTQAKKYLDKCGIGDTGLQQGQLKEEIGKLQKEIDAQTRRIQNYEKKIEELNTKMAVVQKKTEDCRKRTEEKCSQVSTYSQSQEPAENERRTMAEVKHEIDQIDYFIEEVEKKVGNEVISFEKELLQKSANQKKFKKMFRELKRMHEKYREMSKDRKGTIEGVRHISATVVMTQFENVIQSRHYRGYLDFDHPRGRLEIQLAPPDSGSSFMNSESLSGGEKSVSTVAFLMALWSNMDLPFYSMDEYDVFMDAINRRTITKLLTDFAQDKSSRQFIFLTPLDVSLIQTGPNVTVHRVNKVV
ncbi:structural maintenance of chromosomes protein 6-like [Planococcus citri]|uniref:structural maintenance of chromosomes protein 6-like n=1 Tax=Planococcus citri TaxID=170843 RepID=UPI0031F7616B